MPPLSVREAQRLLCEELMSTGTSIKQARKDPRLQDYHESTLFRWWQTYRDTGGELPVDAAGVQEKTVGGGHLGGVQENLHMKYCRN